MHVHGSHVFNMQRGLQFHLLSPHLLASSLRHLNSLLQLRISIKLDERDHAHAPGAHA